MEGALPDRADPRSLVELPLEAFREAVIARKAEARIERAALDFAEKIARLERMREVAGAVRRMRYDTNSSEVTVEESP